jgi:hypothetical protein
VGEHHSRDPRWVAEEWANDGETWGKTITKTRGLATRKEMENGGAKHRLTGGERRVAYHLMEGKEWQRGKSLVGEAFYRGRRWRERERGRGTRSTCR